MITEYDTKNIEFSRVIIKNLILYKPINYKLLYNILTSPPIFYIKKHIPPPFHSVKSGIAIVREIKNADK